MENPWVINSSRFPQSSLEEYAKEESFSTPALSFPVTVNDDTTMQKGYMRNPIS